MKRLQLCFKNPYNFPSIKQVFCIYIITFVYYLIGKLIKKYGNLNKKTMIRTILHKLTKQKLQKFFEEFFYRKFRIIRTVDCFNILKST